MGQDTHTRSTNSRAGSDRTRGIAIAPLFKLEAFEGPLDLLLHLIGKQKIDIYDIPVAEITKQYMRVISRSNLKSLDLDIAGEYLLLASTLVQVKSRMLLPESDENKGDGAEDDFEKDPRAELVRKLLEYQRFKVAAGNLAGIPRFSENVFKPGYTPREIVFDNLEGSIHADDVDVFTLLGIFDRMISEIPCETAHSIPKDSITVSQKIMEIIQHLSSHEGVWIPFRDLFALRSRNEVIVTFLSILELTRLRYIYIYQPDPENELRVRKNFTENEIDFDAILSVEESYSGKENEQTDEEMRNARSD